MDITCIDHHAHLIDMAITRLSFILNIKPEQGIFFFYSIHYLFVVF